MTTGSTGPDHDPVGSLGEEAAKLLGALSGWTRDQAGTAEHVAHGLADSLRQVNDHVATGGADCRYCPLCQVIHAVRTTDPEVRQHLVVAASSLMHAVAGMLETTQRGDAGAAGTGGVRKIDLDEPGEPGEPGDLGAE